MLWKLRSTVTANRPLHLQCDLQGEKEKTIAKVVNITEKLEFDTDPTLVIGNLKVRVRADAETMLKLMGVLSKGESLSTIKEALGLLLSERDLSAICKYKKDGKKLSAKSLMLIVNTAIELVTGEDEGEQ